MPKKPAGILMQADRHPKSPSWRIAPLVIILLSGPVACSAEAPGDWIEVKADAPFSVNAPPGTTFVKLRGKDSKVGAFEGPGFRLKYDYGRYSNPLNTQAEDNSTRDVEVGGKQARLVRTRTPDSSAGTPYFVGIHFLELVKSERATTQLTVSGSVATEDLANDLETILLSIRFNE